MSGPQPSPAFVALSACTSQAEYRNEILLIHTSPTAKSRSTLQGKSTMAAIIKILRFTCSLSGQGAEFQILLELHPVNSRFVAVFKFNRIFTVSYGPRDNLRAGRSIFPQNTKNVPAAAVNSTLYKSEYLHIRICGFHFSVLRKYKNRPNR